jgi:hypothetical protein
MHPTGLRVLFFLLHFLSELAVKHQGPQEDRVEKRGGRKGMCLLPPSDSVDLGSFFVVAVFF